jgi:hypothetical protein
MNKRINASYLLLRFWQLKHAESSLRFELSCQNCIDADVRVYVYE